ncbi:MAG: hypothetical protein PWP54_1651, partial [Thermosipho sp. (in: thermotogales)]|nr:hypothetical protein [Thermosipho sp. (in: thermotogales)]
MKAKGDNVKKSSIALLIIISLVILILLVLFVPKFINKAPNVPINPNPKNDETGISISPTLSWEATDPNGDELVYDIYLGKEGNLELLISNLATNNYTTRKLEFGTTYYWKVVAKDNRGAETEGPIWKFTTNYLPEVPSNPQPENGATNVSTRPILKWKAIDRDGDKLIYDVYFGTNPNFKIPIVSNFETAEFKPENLEFKTTYYWKIVVKDGKGGETEGPIWKFTTIKQNDPPLTPYEPFPFDGTTGQPININLSWKSGDPDKDELSYDLYFGIVGQLQKIASDLKESSYKIENLNYGTMYNWKVIAKDGKGGISESPVWQFTTNYLPEIDKEIEPEDGASGVLINPMLKWSATDRDGDKLTYDLYLGKGEELELVAKDLEENSYMVEGLENGETYSWKIVVKDERGGEVEGPVWKFTTNYLPEVPSNPSPEDGANGILKKVELR